jgi:cytochrome c oxidase cbb3-type subunit 3
MRAGAALALLLVLCGCEREARRYGDTPREVSRPTDVALTPLVPGQPAAPASTESPYRANAFGIAEGKRLFTWYNCNGCHAQGGGGIGPALMDDKWIYGAAPGQIYATIAHGRPNGMPAFGERVPDQQVWQIVAYVQSLSGNVPKDAAPGRSDHLEGRKPELRKEREQPRQTGHR